MIETQTDPISVIARYNHVNASKLRRWYRDHLSNIDQWSQGNHCQDYLLYPQNVSSRIAIDELSLNKGELVTIVTNRLVRGRKGKVIAIIDGTKSEDISRVLSKLPIDKINQVEEVTLDMAKNMSRAVSKVFTRAKLVIDRFHVVRLVQEALQQLRIKRRWEAIDQENQMLDLAKRTGSKQSLEVFANGDTPKQLLARSRYILFKSQHKWTPSQNVRAQILFENYPEIKQAYLMVERFRRIYQERQRRDAEIKMMDWILEAATTLTKEFRSTTSSLIHHLQEILNFFNHRSTNAVAESFNAQLKAIRATQKGVSDYKMFLYRIQKIFA